MVDWILPEEYRWSKVTSVDHSPEMPDILIWGATLVPVWIVCGRICGQVSKLTSLRSEFAIDSSDTTDANVNTVDRHSSQDKSKDIAKNRALIADVLLSLLKKTSLLVYMSIVLSHRDWFLNAHNLWSNFPHHKFDGHLKVLYFLQMAWYFYQFYNHIFSAHLSSRHDALVMVGHHCVTMSLLICSYSWGYLRIGLLVLYWHDISDWTLSCGKLFYYTENGTLTTVFLLASLLSWPVTRLWYFPRHIIWPVYTVALPIVDEEYHFEMHLCCSLLWILVAMHAWWYSHLVSAAYQKVTKGNFRDTTE